MNKKAYIFLIIIILLIILVVAGIKFSGQNTWLCREGQWVKHGNPKSAMPAGSCLETSKPVDSQKEEKTTIDGTSQTPEPQANIIVINPQPNQEVCLPLIIEGQARVFESQFNYRLKDEDDSILFEGNTTAQAQEMGEYGPFQVEFNYPQPKGQVGTLEVFDYSAKDGSVIDLVLVPVRFTQVESLIIKVFFTNSQLDPQVSCDKVFSVDRRIPKTVSVAKLALQELLTGPNPQEIADGYQTNINFGTKVNRLVIEDGVAQVDFNDQLESQVGGSCRVTAIRAQITQTLKQFPTVSDVVISINGRTEDILQS